MWVNLILFSFLYKNHMGVTQGLKPQCHYNVDTYSFHGKLFVSLGKFLKMYKILRFL
jgi:hypothetical protein